MSTQFMERPPMFDFGAEVAVLPLPLGGWPYYVEARSDRLRRDEAYATSWFRERKPAFDAALTRAGALILRGFCLTDAESFSRFTAHYPPMPQGYSGGS